MDAFTVVTFRKIKFLVAPFDSSSVVIMDAEGNFYGNWYNFASFKKAVERNGNYLIPLCKKWVAFL